MMISKTSKLIAPALHGRPPPVRVKLRRMNADMAKAHPPDGDGKIWWGRVRKGRSTTPSKGIRSSFVRNRDAPRGSRNGNYRRGDWTTEAIEERRWLRSLVRAFAKTGTG